MRIGADFARAAVNSLINVVKVCSINKSPPKI